MTAFKSSDAAFHGLGIAPRLLAIIEKLKFTTPTPIQEKAIPAAVQGKDVIGIAQTGTGKTLAFGIPMIQRIAQHAGRGLVLLPTRELALQVDKTLHDIGRELGLRTVLLIGGMSMKPQVADIRKNPHIIIGTPGRIIDHLEQHTLSLDSVSILVLDEADRMLDMGFAPQIRKILGALPKTRQTLLFSATMPDDIVSIATKHMALPLRIEVAPQGSTVEHVEQEIFIVKKEAKLGLLEKTLTEFQGTVLVFSRTKYGASRLAHILCEIGERAAEIHSNRSLGQRIQALEGFKSGRYRVLVATDIAARGIDVTGIGLVVNYDLPESAEDYVHRIGRTGRAGKEGKAISFATPDQRGEIRSIERLIRKPLPLSRHESVSELLFSMENLPKQRVGGGFRGRRPVGRGFAPRGGGGAYGSGRLSGGGGSQRRRFSR